MLNYNYSFEKAKAKSKDSKSSDTPPASPTIRHSASFDRSHRRSNSISYRSRGVPGPKEHYFQRDSIDTLGSRHSLFFNQSEPDSPITLEKIGTQAPEPFIDLNIINVESEKFRRSRQASTGSTLSYRLDGMSRSNEKNIPRSYSKSSMDGGSSPQHCKHHHKHSFSQPPGFLEVDLKEFLEDEVEEEGSIPSMDEHENPFDLEALEEHYIFNELDIMLPASSNDLLLKYQSRQQYEDPNITFDGDKKRSKSRSYLGMIRRGSFLKNKDWAKKDN